MILKNIKLTKSFKIEGIKNNILFITGISGSGKSTLAYNIKKANKDKKIIIFPIDIIFSFSIHTKEDILIKYVYDIEDDFLRAEFIKFVEETPEFYFNYRDDFNDQLVSINSCSLFKLFLHKVLPKLKIRRQDNTYYIFEGFQIFMENPKLFKEYAVIVLTTSYVKSAIRAYNRDKHKTYIINNEEIKIKNILFKKRILKMFSKNNIHFQGLNILKKFIKEIKEN